MELLDLTLPTLAENVALDEALLLAAEAGGGEVLRLWEWPTPAVVLGAAGRLHDEIDVAACVADGVPIARRSSGGGSVLLGSGCMLFSLVLAFDRDPALADLHGSYRYILSRLSNGLSVQGTTSFSLGLQGISDLAMADRKVSGNAQQRKRTHLLHHGTILYAFDASRLARYLKFPPRQPAYRQGRPHQEFVANVPRTAPALKDAIASLWDAATPCQAWPHELTATLVREKYEKPEWIHRR